MFWFAWASLGEEELSWAAYKVYDIVNVYKKKSLFNFLFLKIFLLKHNKREKQNHKTRGIFDLVFVRLMHQSGLGQMVAILSEFSHCLSDFG